MLYTIGKQICYAKLFWWSYCRREGVQWLGPWTEAKKQLTSIPDAYELHCIFTALPLESHPHQVAITHLEPNDTHSDNISYYFNLSNHATYNTAKLLGQGQEKIYILWPTRNFPLSQCTAFSANTDRFINTVFYKWRCWPQIKESRMHFDPSWLHFTPLVYGVFNVLSSISHK